MGLSRNDSGRRGRLVTLGALLFIIGLGLALRLHRLSEQSVWYDEYISVVHVDAPDLLTCLRAQRQLNWNLVPLYYALQYLWANTVTKSIAGIRVLSIIFGMLGAPLIYLIGRELYGRRAGLVAALCLSLSSVHIVQAQELRNYSLTTLTALLSAYTFVRIVRNGDRRWWGLHFAANLLLVWTHLFGCFLLVAEGCFLLAFHVRRWRRLAVWFGAGLALMLPSLLWIRTIHDTVAPVAPLPLGTIVNNFFADCASYTFGWFMPMDIAWEVTPPAWTEFFARTYLRADRAHLLFFIVSIAYLGVHALVSARFDSRGRLSHTFQTRSKDGRNELEPFVFLALWVFLPGLILFALSRTWRPDIFSSKYTTYSSLGVYLMLGGMVELLRKPIPRTLAVCILLVLYGHRLALTATRPQRTDWRSATNHIKAQRTPDDVIIVSGWVQDLVCRYNMRPVDTPVYQGKDLEEFCKKTDQFLAEGHAVWAVCIAFGLNAPETFERFLSLRGVPFSRKAYWSSAQWLFVYHITKDEAFTAAGDGELPALYKRATEEPSAAP